MGSDPQRSEAVYLATVNADFCPERPWHLPDAATSLTLHCKNLTTDQAAGFIFAHNKRELEAFQRGEPISTWAIVVRRTKPRYIKQELRRIRQFLDAQLAAAGGEPEGGEE